MRSYERYCREDDKRTITGWFIGGALVALIVTGDWLMFFFIVSVTYAILRCLENIDNNRPVYLPGKHSRHLQESIDRFINDRYDGGYIRRVRRNRF